MFEDLNDEQQQDLNASARAEEERAGGSTEAVQFTPSTAPLEVAQQPPQTAPVSFNRMTLGAESDLMEPAGAGPRTPQEHADYDLMRAEQWGRVSRERQAAGQAAAGPVARDDYRQEMKPSWYEGQLSGPPDPGAAPHAWYQPAHEALKNAYDTYARDLPAGSRPTEFAGMERYTHLGQIALLPSGSTRATVNPEGFRSGQGLAGALAHEAAHANQWNHDPAHSRLTIQLSGQHPEVVAPISRAFDDLAERGYFDRYADPYAGYFGLAPSYVRSGGMSYEVPYSIRENYWH